METHPTVLLVDRHDMFRAGLRTLLDGEGIRVAAECSGLGSALDAAGGTPPQVVLFDAQIQEQVVRDALRDLMAQWHWTVFALLTNAFDDVTVAAALRSGIHGYILKDTEIKELGRAVNALAEGEGFLSPPIARKALDYLRTGVTPTLDMRPPDMSERELQVLCLLAEGIENAEIAERLSISPKTVKNHVASIFQKLGLQNRVQAAVYAVRNGIV
jgi:DNA-binding NarL/FixJ family response regulator